MIIKISDIFVYYLSQSEGYSSNCDLLFQASHPRGRRIRPMDASPPLPDILYDLKLSWTLDLLHMDHEPSNSRVGGDKRLPLLTPSSRRRGASERSSRTVVTEGRITSQAPIRFICNLGAVRFVVFCFFALIRFPHRWIPPQFSSVFFHRQP